MTTRGILCCHEWGAGILLSTSECTVSRTTPRERSSPTYWQCQGCEALGWVLFRSARLCQDVAFTCIPDK